MSISYHLHHNDLPAGLRFSGDLAVDTETRGLSIQRDRLCLVQLKSRDSDIHLVKITQGQNSAPNLQKLLEDRSMTKIFHYARIDIAMLKQWLNIDCQPVFCTKIASKLVRTYSERHGLKDVTREIIGVDISKQQQLTDWAADELTPEQLEYAASDVLYLHELKDKLSAMLVRENRMHLAQACFDFLPARSELDRLDWEEIDIFAHS